AFYAFFWMLNVTMTRVYAQVGPPILELYFLDPQKTLTTLPGTAAPPPPARFPPVYLVHPPDRGPPMAPQLASFYVGKGTGVPPRLLGRWVLLAFTLGSLACLVFYLHWVYRVGEDQFVEGGWRETFSPLALARINQWVKTPTD